MASSKAKEIWEFGDFQTPDSLAIQILDVLRQMEFEPATIIEPTCGRGNLLINAIKAYPYANKYVGVDVNSNHLKKLNERVKYEELDADIKVLHANFFDLEWKNILKDLSGPFLIIGNPPWVTSSELSLLQSSNLPEKSNFQGRNGLDALTGKSNFDISEWMILQNLLWLQDRDGLIAMLCKTTVARKILSHAWRKDLQFSSAQIYKVDAKKYFNAAVDACLLIMNFNQRSLCHECIVFDSVDSRDSNVTLGYQDNIILSDTTTYQKLRCLRGEDKYYTWRSGIKHDCSKIMELSWNGTCYVNGYAESCYLEEDFIYPLFKSSDIGNNRMTGRSKYMLVTQKHIGEDTRRIKEIAPKTWNYLQRNKEFLAKRGSSIYRNRPIFSVFGVGDYTFSPWKVAISGFYKRLNFVVVPPVNGKPVVFDDTVYFLSCTTEKEANFVIELLRSNEAREFLESMIFWEDKRPITIEVLKRLSIHSLACHLNREDEYNEIIKQRGLPIYSAQVTQLRLLEKPNSYNP